MGIGPDLVTPPFGSRVLGVVVDIPADGGFVTVVALADGTTSMYTSVGGGTIGAGGHENVAAATSELITIAERALAEFTLAGSTGFPDPGFTRIHVLELESSHMEDVPEDAFWGRAPHALLPVIGAIQAVIGALRTVDPA